MCLRRCALTGGSRTRSWPARPSGRPARRRRTALQGAGLAADRGVAVLEQRVDHQPVQLDVARPRRRRSSAAIGATLTSWRLASQETTGVLARARGVGPAQAGGPGGVRLQGPAQRGDLAQRAALVGVAGEQVLAPGRVLLGDGLLGRDVDQVDVVHQPGRRRGCRWSRRSGSRCRGRPRRCPAPPARPGGSSPCRPSRRSRPAGPNSRSAQVMISSALAPSSSRLASTASSDRSSSGAHRRRSLLTSPPLGLRAIETEERHGERPQAAAAFPAAARAGTVSPPRSTGST